MLAFGVADISYREHALERYGERVRVAAAPSAIEPELRAVAANTGAIVEVPPLWAPWDARTPAYLQIGEDILFPLVVCGDAVVAKTCLIRGWLPRSVRAAKRAHRAAKRAQRRPTGDGRNQP